MIEITFIYQTKYILFGVNVLRNTAEVFKFYGLLMSAFEDPYAFFSVSHSYNAVMNIKQTNSHISDNTLITSSQSPYPMSTEFNSGYYPEHLHQNKFRKVNLPN